MGTLQIVVRKASSLEIILCLQFITIHYPEVASLLLRGKYPCKNSAALSSLLNYSVELQEAVQANKTVSRSAGFFSLWAGCRKLLFAREPRQAGQVLCGSALAGRPFGKQIESGGRAGGEPGCPVPTRLGLGGDPASWSCPMVSITSMAQSWKNSDWAGWILITALICRKTGNVLAVYVCLDSPESNLLSNPSLLVSRRWLCWVTH